MLLREGAARGLSPRTIGSIMSRERLGALCSPAAALVA